MKIEQCYTVLHSNIVTRALVRCCLNVLTTYHLILKNGQLVARITPNFVPFQIISNVILCCYWYERHGSSKRMCLYFDVLMFPICLFTFQFSNKTRVCKYITRLFENIIYHKEKYTRLPKDSGLLWNYSSFTLHSGIRDGVRSTICHNL